MTSVDTPEIEFVSDEVDIPGATAKINIVNPYQVSAMTVTINHNHGNGCDGLNTPEPVSYTHLSCRSHRDWTH